jgi:hypothetical protein
MRGEKINKIRFWRRVCPTTWLLKEHHHLILIIRRLWKRRDLAIISIRISSRRRRLSFWRTIAPTSHLFRMWKDNQVRRSLSKWKKLLEEWTSISTLWMQEWQDRMLTTPRNLNRWRLIGTHHSTGKSRVKYRGYCREIKAEIQTLSRFRTWPQMGIQWISTWIQMGM